ncbi:hypothetical protein DH2020_005307 [Rehmannia glutinosa]|uniref:MSP domain-containing protein n=1 Tax=Rehmannia glutinosa TaxID=99300 RepID=A0ABR0XG67_REHGL
MDIVHLLGYVYILVLVVELGKQTSCTVRLSNFSRDHVAFKVMTTNPKNYCVMPNNGVLLPRSTCDVEVFMRAPKVAPSDMQCKDKFLIKSVLASPGDTANSYLELFNEEGRVVESCKLRVVYEFSSNQQSSNSEISAAAAGKQWRDVGDLFIGAITIVLLCLIFGYLIVKMLPLIWSLTFMITMLVIKMTKKLVSDSVEDWVVKTLLYLSVHFLSVVFKRRQSRPNNES